MSDAAWAMLATGLTVVFALIGTSYTARMGRTTAVDIQLDSRTQRLIDNLNADNDLVRAEVAALRAEVIALRPLAARFTGVNLEELQPMGDLHELGWNSYSNHNYANRHGIHIVPYHDDIDEQFALGFYVVPIEEVPPSKVTSSAMVVARERRLAKFAADARKRRGLDPYPLAPIDDDDG